MANSTYSAKDVIMAFFHPEAGTYIMNGNQGMGQFTVMNATERTVHSVAADGSIMVSAIAGDNGSVQVEAQQTSTLHHFLINWFNIVKTSMDVGDVSNWATAVVEITSILDGSKHILTGVSPSKVPDKPYQAQGQNVTWNLMAASVIHF